MSRPSKWLRPHIAAVVVLAGLSSSLVVAQDPQREPSASGLAAGSADRFGRYEDSFVVWNGMRNPGWTHADEQALRARFSFKYTFCGPQLVRKTENARLVDAKPKPRDSSICPEGGYLENVEMFAAYTGEFDFYWQTRRSGPVINRISAPGLFFRKSLAQTDGWLEDADSVEIGIQHRSDGQVADGSSPRGAEVAQANYNLGNHAYFDTISRDSNYLSFAFDRRHKPFGKVLDLRAKLRLYIGGEDSKVTWGPLANTGRRYADYDRLDLRASYHVAEHHRLEAQWRIGDKGLATDSWTLGWRWDLWDLPLYLRWHRGPMNTLSNYTQRQDSFGVGLQLSRF